MNRGLLIPTREPAGAWRGKEDDMQIQVMSLARMILPRAMIWHTPNEGRRGPIFTKARGILAGIPDVMIVLPDGHPYPGAALELKVWPNKPTPAQMERLAHLEALGWCVGLAYGTDEAMAFLDKLKPKTPIR